MDETKSARINVRLGEEERGAIGRRAASVGLTVSEYIRRAALRDDDRPVIRADVRELRAIHADLRRAGGNINQIARALNRSVHPSLDEKAASTLKSVADAAEAVSAFVRDVHDSL